MKELMVVAIGGNSIIKDNASQSIEHQAQAVKAVAESVLEMLASDYDIVLTHGNGPQVGLDLRRAEIAHEREGLPLTPLANCVADTCGGIGYLIQQALNNRLAARGEQKAVTVVTQVEVDKNDRLYAPDKTDRRVLQRGAARRATARAPGLAFCRGFRPGLSPRGGLAPAAAHRRGGCD